MKNGPGHMNVWKVAVVSLAIAGIQADGGGTAHATAEPRAPAASPILYPDFHFSDRARDARYWQLQGVVERRMAAFSQVAFAAGHAVAVPGPQPGSPAWLGARTLVERALLVRRPARDALNALIFYLRRERPHLTAEEAEEASNIIRVHEESLLATSDRLVDLFARLSGVRPGQWPP
jgi:hypothetical protein